MGKIKLMVTLVVFLLLSSLTFGMYDTQAGRFISMDPLGIAPDAQKPNVFSVIEQYRDGANIYEYVLSNPVLYNDPYGLCGCVVKRAKSDIFISGSAINAGHEWIKCGGNSIGFWPNRGWKAISPDPAEEAGVPAYTTWETKKDEGWFSEKKLKWGSVAGKKCCAATCSDIVSCVMSSPNPGWKSWPIINNCRRFVSVTLSGCCLKKK